MKKYVWVIFLGFLVSCFSLFSRSQLEEAIKTILVISELEDSPLHLLRNDPVNLLISKFVDRYIKDEKFTSEDLEFMRFLRDKQIIGVDVVNRAERMNDLLSSIIKEIEYFVSDDSDIDEVEFEEFADQVRDFYKEFPSLYLVDLLDRFYPAEMHRIRSMDSEEEWSDKFKDIIRYRNI